MGSQIKYSFLAHLRTYCFIKIKVPLVNIVNIYFTLLYRGKLIRLYKDQTEIFKSFKMYADIPSFTPSRCSSRKTFVDDKHDDRRNAMRDYIIET